MGKALEVIHGRVTNPSTTITATAAVTGDSLTVRSTNFGTSIEIIQAWAFTTGTQSIMRVRSPRMHDQAQNIRLQCVASKAYPIWPVGAGEPLYPQDPITVELTGGSSETDLAALLVYYQDLPGIAANLHQWAEIEPLIQHLTSVEVDITYSATTCQYSATTALNGTFDNLIRNRQYAILGYETSLDVGSVGIKGADTGNLRVGGPLLALQRWTSAWFRDLSDSTGYPCIPVFNSANVAGILCDVITQGTSGTANVSFNLALLQDNSNLS